ncbi:MAG: type II toxin-antitoxin system VapC family toxin [Thioploca sp.]|nr:type II toxin-antitoxin system VapC family toxin [Thioploca sp.]
MKGLDANVVIRYLVQDDLEQSAIATTFIERECTETQPGFICHIVLCEVIWVLKTCYKVPKEKLVEIIQALIETKQLSIQEPQVVWEALQVYQESTADFSDVLLMRVNQSKGCEYTVSFDAKAVKLLGMVKISKSFSKLD